MGFSDCLKCVNFQLNIWGSPDTSKNAVHTVRDF